MGSLTLSTGGVFRYSSRASSLMILCAFSFARIPDLYNKVYISIAQLTTSHIPFEMKELEQILLQACTAPTQSEEDR